MSKKGSSKSHVFNTDNGISGPTFLEGFTDHIENSKELHSHEWRRKLKSSSGNNKFKIKYYGELHEDYNYLIVETNFAPALLIAVDVISGEEILYSMVVNMVTMLCFAIHLHKSKLPIDH